jgi:hypothetical protein
MKPNTIQKSILLIILVLLIISFLFFIPIREYYSADITTIVYKSIFYTDGRIDFVRLVIQTLLIFLVGIFLFFATTDVKNINWQSPSIKKIIKRELKYVGSFMLFVLIATILYSIIFLTNLYQLKKWNKIEYSISKLNQSKDSVSAVITKKELLEKNFAYDIGQIISYSKDPKAYYFTKLITNDFDENLKQSSEILQTGDAGYLPPPPKRKFSSKITRDNYNPFEDNVNEKPYYIFDNIVNISNRNLDFVDFLNVIKRIKVVELKNTEDVLSMKKIKKVKTNSSKNILSPVVETNDPIEYAVRQAKANTAGLPQSQSLELTRAIVFGNKNELELYSVTGVINKLPYYQKLASQPKLFLEKINGLINNENASIIESNSLIDRTKLLKTKLIQVSFFDFNIIEQVCMIIALCLFFLLFIVRYAAYSIKSFINYLK